MLNSRTDVDLEACGIKSEINVRQTQEVHLTRRTVRHLLHQQREGLRNNKDR